MKIKDLESRIEILEKFIKEKNTPEPNLIITAEDSKVVVPAKAKRAPSLYNIHVQTEISRLRSEMGQSFDIKEAFKIAVKTWNDKKSTNK